MITVNNKVAVAEFRKAVEVKVSTTSGLAVMQQKKNLQECKTVFAFKTQSGTLVPANTRVWVIGELSRAELPVQEIGGVEFVIIDENQLRIIDV